ncbi:MAG: GGDEF domain-containing protein [Alphaproteobacteria bacterium]|nr:GGDEF domain-containing protein [Alphaproteobacteria bacterium]
MRDEVEPEPMLAAAAAAVARAVPLSGCVICQTAAEGFEAVATFGDTPASGIDIREPIVAGEGARAIAAPGYVGLALLTHHQGKPNGLVGAWRRGEPVPSDTPPWTSDEHSLLLATAAHLGLAIQQYRHQREMRRLSDTDGLTGLLNRRRFRELLQARAGLGGCLVYVDLDNFKAVNDRHGHQRGDAVLQTLGDWLREAAEGDDLVGRLGGDEFVFWMAGAGGTTALARAERLLSVSSALGPLSASLDLPLSISIGLAVRPPGGEETLDSLIARGDAAMYRAKRAGKNRIAQMDDAVC